MKGGGEPDWRERGPAAPEPPNHGGKHVSFHESVKHQRPPQYDYSPRLPPVTYPPPTMHRHEVSAEGGRWVFEPDPRASWQPRGPPRPRPFYDSPPRPPEPPQFGGPPSPRQPFLPPPPAPHSPGFRRVPEHEQPPYRPPRIPYRRPPPIPAGGEGYPSPKRQRMEPRETLTPVQPPNSTEEETGHSRGNSLSLLAKVAMQGDETSQPRKDKGNSQQQYATITPPQHIGGVVPPSPGSPTQRVHKRTPSWRALMSPGLISHARVPSWQLQWMSPDQRRQRSPRTYPPDYRYGGGGPPPDSIQQMPSWGSMSPTVVEQDRSFDAVESPPGQYVRSGSTPFRYGYYSPEGLTYSSLGPPSPYPPRHPGGPRASEPPPPQSRGGTPYESGGYPSYPPERPPPPYLPQVNHVSPGSHYGETPPYYPPYSYVQQPQLETKTILRKKFSWKHYPELERFLIANRDEYLRHSAMNYTAEQKKYNNWLTSQVIAIATRHNYEFDANEFNFVGIRDRIRCYYKSYVQTARKKGYQIVPYRVKRDDADAHARMQHQEATGYTDKGDPAPKADGCDLATSRTPQLQQQRVHTHPEETKIPDPQLPGDSEESIKELPTPSPPSD